MHSNAVSRTAAALGTCMELPAAKWGFSNASYGSSTAVEYVLATAVVTGKPSKSNFSLADNQRARVGDQRRWVPKDTKQGRTPCALDALVVNYSNYCANTVIHATPHISYSCTFAKVYFLLLLQYYCTMAKCDRLTWKVEKGQGAV